MSSKANVFFLPMGQIVLVTPRASPSPSHHQASPEQYLLHQDSPIVCPSVKTPEPLWATVVDVWPLLVPCFELSLSEVSGHSWRMAMGLIVSFFSQGPIPGLSSYHLPLSQPFSSPPNIPLGLYPLSPKCSPEILPAAYPNSSCGFTPAPGMALCSHTHRT